MSKKSSDKMSNLIIIEKKLEKTRTLSRVDYISNDYDGYQ